MKREKTNDYETCRSGEYQQTAEVLRDNYGYCCLGVLCDITKPEGWDGAKFGDEYQQLPTEVRKEFGLSIADQAKLIQMNDTQEKSFEQIASYIESRKTI